MGLGKDFLEDLIELKTRGALTGAKRIVEIGAQQLCDELILSPRLRELERLFSCSRLHFDPVGPENFTENAPLARPFWHHIGLVHESLDLRGGTISFDLNRRRVPWGMRGVFDLVVNGGTTEHVANQNNAFRAIHELTRPGGVMYHELPSLGWLDHGMIAYQPKFFHHLSRDNDYEILFFKIVPNKSWSAPDYFYEYNSPYNLPIPESGPSVMLRAAFRKKDNRKFKTPVDGY